MVVAINALNVAQACQHQQSQQLELKESQKLKEEGRPRK
jgi:hypothetical protein